MKHGVMGSKAVTDVSDLDLGRKHVPQRVDWFNTGRGRRPQASLRAYGALRECKGAEKLIPQRCVGGLEVDWCVFTIWSAVLCSCSAEIS